MEVVPRRPSTVLSLWNLPTTNGFLLPPSFHGHANESIGCRTSHVALWYPVLVDHRIAFTLCLVILSQVSRLAPDVVVMVLLSVPTSCLPGTMEVQFSVWNNRYVEFF